MKYGPYFAKYFLAISKAKSGICRAPDGEPRCAGPPAAAVRSTMSTPPKRIRLYALKQSTVGHTAIGLWCHPESQAARYTELDYWTSTAKTLEEGRFDGLFIADALGVHDVYGGTADLTLRHGVQTPTDDPLLAISAMAAVTRRLGFAVTVSTSYELPYAFARKMTTLDHLTQGRIGWNIVTSALESAARNLGLLRQVPHDERYAIAQEFMEVVYKLWEASWQDEAVVADRRRGIFVDPGKVRRIALAAGGPTFVGSPSTVADAMEQWMIEGDLDGFNVLDPMPLCSYPEFVTWVVPELQRRGRVWREYEGATLREYLQGVGQTRVLSTHPAGVIRDSHQATAVAAVGAEQV
jgi:alkanesulfonate monooxygenase SsuD/methylene tetrahydromethanopterin reductase-like flavin-dependent oxidoreductase (luciferase family)